jgi:hypothetical protein
LRKYAATQRNQHLPPSFAGTALPRLDESVKPRELSAVERETQIVVLWRDRAPDQRRPKQIAVFLQWLSDYTPWLVPPGEQPLDTVTAIVRPHVIGE